MPSGATPYQFGEGINQLREVLEAQNIFQNPILDPDANNLFKPARASPRVDVFPVGRPLVEAEVIPFRQR